MLILRSNCHDYNNGSLKVFDGEELESSSHFSRFMPPRISAQEGYFKNNFFMKLLKFCIIRPNEFRFNGTKIVSQVSYMTLYSFYKYKRFHILRTKVCVMLFIVNTFSCFSCNHQCLSIIFIVY
jgi:hypothetical protein